MMTKANNVYVGDFGPNPRARAVYTLYRAKRITIEGVKQAVVDGIITEFEYAQITGEQYA